MAYNSANANKLITYEGLNAFKTALENKFDGKYASKDFELFYVCTGNEINDPNMDSAFPYPNALELERLGKLSLNKIYLVAFSNEDTDPTLLDGYLEYVFKGDIVDPISDPSSWECLGRASIEADLDSFLEAYLTKLEAAGIYLTKEEAGNTYLSKEDAANTYVNTNYRFDDLGSQPSRGYISIDNNRTDGAGITIMAKNADTEETRLIIDNGVFVKYPEDSDNTTYSVITSKEFVKASVADIQSLFD